MQHTVEQGERSWPEQSRFTIRCYRGSLRNLLVGGILAVLTGCGANVSRLTSSLTPLPPPSEILVAAGPYQDGQGELAQQVSVSIQKAVVERLTKAHITAEPYVPNQTHPGAAILQLGVTQADPGSLPARFLIGFGVGKAELRVNAALVPSDKPDAAPVLGFDTAADSGIKPGLIVPGAVALGTGRVVGLAVGGGIDVATNIRGGMARPISQTAAAIVKQLKTYYASAGWAWPAPS